MSEKSRFGRRICETMNEVFPPLIPSTFDGKLMPAGFDSARMAGISLCSKFIALVEEARKEFEVAREISEIEEKAYYRLCDWFFTWFEADMEPKK